MKIKNKGMQGLRCNRTACENQEAYYYNRVMKAYYCEPCAFRINVSALRSGQKELCICSDEDRIDWIEALYKRRYEKVR